MDMENEPQNRIRAPVLVPPSHEVFRDNEIRKPSRFNSFGLDKEIFSHISDLCVSPTTSSRASTRDSFSPVHQWFRQNWLVFALILGFVLSTLIAVAHLLFFAYLDKKKVAETVSQNVVSIISVGLVRLHSVSMTATLSTALCQLVWRYYRTHTLSLATVDSLFKLCTHFLSLTLPHAIVHTPGIAVVGVCIACVPIAMIFPPSALTVESLPISGSLEVQAPSFNPALRSPANPRAMNYDNFLTLTRIDAQNPTDGLCDSEGCWVPSDPAQITSYKMEVIGGLLPAGSPCGQNCSYTLHLTTPGYSCSEEHEIDLPELLFPISEAEGGFGITFKQFLDSDITYMAGQNYSTAVINDTTHEVVRLEFEYGWSKNSRHHLSCIYYENTTTAELTYANGFLVSATMLASFGTPLNASIFLNAARLGAGVESIVGGKPESPIAQAISSDDLIDLSVFGQHQAIATSVSGMEFFAIGSDVQDGSGSWFYNVLLPPNDGDDPLRRPFPINTARLQELLFNYTISYLTLYPNEHVPVLANTSNWEDTYVFRNGPGGQQWHLYGPYMATSITGLVVLLAGLWALFMNGKSAQATFLQALRNTALADEKLRTEAAQCSEGGYGNLTKELRNMKVRFVSVGQHAEDEQGRRTVQMAFRRVEEGITRTNTNPSTSTMSEDSQSTKVVDASVGNEPEV